MDEDNDLGIILLMPLMVLIESKRNGVRKGFRGQRKIYNEYVNSEYVSHGTSFI